MRRRLAVGAGAAILALGVTGCYAYPHSDNTLFVCAEFGWGSNVCGIFLCDDWAAHYDRPYSECPPSIRWGDGPR